MASKFRTAFSERVIVDSNPGSRMANDYISVYDEDGKRQLKVAGEYNIYEQIQAHRPNCDLKMILKRYKQTGDPTLLERRQAVYADVTDIPTNYADVLRLHDAASNLFMVLDADQKAAFDNNVDQFLASFGTEKFNDVMGIVSEKPDSELNPVTPPKQEVE